MVEHDVAAPVEVVEEAGFDGEDAEGGDAGTVEVDGVFVFEGVVADDAGGDGVEAGGEDGVEQAVDAAGNVAAVGFDEFADPESAGFLPEGAVGFAFLDPEVRAEDLDGGAVGADGVGDAGDEEDGQDAAVEAAGGVDDEVGFAQGGEEPRVGGGAGGEADADAADGASAPLPGGEGLSGESDAVGVFVDEHPGDGGGGVHGAGGDAEDGGDVGESATEGGGGRGAVGAEGGGAEDGGGHEEVPEAVAGDEEAAPDVGG